MATNIRERRRILIAIARRRARSGSGSSRESLLRRTAIRQWLDLGPVLDPLPWAVVGDVATRRYMPERATQDLDILIDGRNTREVRRRLQSAGLRYRQDLPTVGGSIWETGDGTEIDVLEAREDWLMDALSRARDHRDAQGLPTLPLPALVLMKFRSGRILDVADVSRMLGLADPETVEHTRSLFQTLEPSGLEDLESLLTLGRMELDDA